MSYDKFKSLIDEKYEWPCQFKFKFVVAVHKENELASLFIEESIQKKNSKTGKYISYTFDKLVNSSDEVVEVYKRAGAIESVISL